MVGGFARGAGLLAALLLAAPAAQADRGFLSRYYAGTYCWQVQFYEKPGVWFGIWLDRLGKLGQVQATLDSIENKVVVGFRQTGRILDCQESFGSVREIAGVAHPPLDMR